MYVFMLADQKICIIYCNKPRNNIFVIDKLTSFRVYVKHVLRKVAEGRSLVRHINTEHTFLSHGHKDEHNAWGGRHTSVLLGTSAGGRNSGTTAYFQVACEFIANSKIYLVNLRKQFVGLIKY